MAKRVFKTDLSAKGIEQLKKDLLNYKNNTLRNKIQKYVSRLLGIGIDVARVNINKSPIGNYITLTSNVTSLNNNCKGILLAKGVVLEEVDKDGNPYPPFSTILAIEFGAGIHYNPISNPNAGNFGLGVGTFPGQTHAFEDTWFYWDETEQLWKPTHGVKATMPMYNAQMKIIKEASKLAREVFG